MRLIDGRGRVLADPVDVARSIRSRALGLMGRRAMLDSTALLLEPAKQVHTFGMRFDIDVVFCDRDGVVVHLVHGLGPHRVTRWVGSARFAVEAAKGSFSQVRVGDRLTLEDD